MRKDEKHWIGIDQRRKEWTNFYYIESQSRILISKPSFIPPFFYGKFLKFWSWRPWNHSQPFDENWDKCDPFAFEFFLENICGQFPWNGWRLIANGGGVNPMLGSLRSRIISTFFSPYIAVNLVGGLSCGWIELWVIFLRFDSSLSPPWRSEPAWRKNTKQIDVFFTRKILMTNIFSLSQWWQIMRPRYINFDYTLCYNPHRSRRKFEFLETSLKKYLTTLLSSKLKSEREPFLEIAIYPADLECSSKFQMGLHIDHVILQRVKR